jgi:hypothetical protein
MRIGVLIAILVLVLLPPASEAAGSVQLAGPGGCCVRAAVDDDGTARVGYVELSTSRPQTFWATAARSGAQLPSGGRLLRIGAGHISSGSPVFAWDGRGRAVAAWRGAAREADPSARGVSVYAASQRGDGSWTAPQRVSRPRRGARYPVIDVDRAGNAIVAWWALTRRGWRVEAAHRSLGTEVFRPRRVMSAPTVPSGELVVAVAGDRWAIAYAGGRAVHLVAGANAAARRFAMRARGDSIYEGHFAVATGPDGTAAIAWNEDRFRTSTWRAFGAVLPAGAPAPLVRRLGADRPSADAEGSPLPDVGVRVVVTPSGETLFAVPRTADSGRLGIVTVAPGASTWTAPEPIGSDGGTDVQLYLAADGRVAAIWTDWSSGDPAVRVTVRQATGPFAPPIEIAHDLRARWPAVAIHGDQLAAGWLSDDGIRGIRTTVP